MLMLCLITAFFQLMLFVLNAIWSIDTEKLSKVNSINFLVEVVQVQTRNGATKDALELPMLTEVHYLTTVMLSL
jgi:hypothetical protein